MKQQVRSAHHRLTVPSMIAVTVLLGGCSSALLKPPALTVPGNAFGNAREDVNVAIKYAEHVESIFGTAANQTEDANLGLGAITFVSTALTAAAGAFGLDEDVLLAAGLATGSSAGLNAYLSPKQKQSLFLEAQRSIQCAVEATSKMTGETGAADGSRLKAKVQAIDTRATALEDAAVAARYLKLALSGARLSSLSAASAASDALVTKSGRASAQELRLITAAAAVPGVIDPAIAQLDRSMSVASGAARVMNGIKDEVESTPNKLVNTVIRVQQAVVERFFEINHSVDFNKIAGLIISDDVKKLLDKSEELGQEAGKNKASNEALASVAPVSGAQLQSLFTAGAIDVQPFLKGLGSQSPNVQQMTTSRIPALAAPATLNNPTTLLGASYTVSAQMSDDTAVALEDAKKPLDDAVKAMRSACPGAV